MRNLFNQDADNDFYEDIECLFIENDIESEEIKEYADDIYEIIKQKEVKYEYEHTEEVNYVKIKQCMIDDEECLVDSEYIVVKEKKVEYCKVEDQNEEIKMLISPKEIEIIEDNIECELIEGQKVDYYELIRYVNVIHSIIEQEEAIDYDVNYRRCEKVQEIDYIEYKPFLVKESSDYTIDYEPIKSSELIEDQK